MQRLRYLAARKHSTVYEFIFAATAFGIALVTRYELDGLLPPGFPYLTFFPAVILTGFFASTRAGVAVAVLCGLAAWYFFIAPTWSWTLTGPGILALVFYVFIVATDLALIHAMRIALNKLQDERETSLRLAQQNKTMFHELQHRVSNNLQVIASLLKMQQRNLSDPSARQALETASARLKTIGTIQRQLHNPKRQATDIGQVLQHVLPEVIEGSDLQGKIALEFDTRPLVASADQATPIALIAVELVSNAIEHAGLEDRQIRIRVHTDSNENTGTLIISDDGKGLPEGFQPEKSRSLGLRVAHQFTEQLEGTLHFASRDGTTVTLSFPLSQPQDS